MRELSTPPQPCTIPRTEVALKTIPLIVVLVAAVLAADPAAGAGTRPPPLVVRLGQGAGPWRLNMPLTIRSGLLRSERHRENDQGGCIGGPVQASRVDYYAGLRVSWIFFARKPRSALVEIATTRRGSRSGDGFAIGKATFAAVRRAHPNAFVARRDLGPYALGRTRVGVYRKTGYESGQYLDYWFDRRGVLAGLSTGLSGC